MALSSSEASNLILAMILMTSGLNAVADKANEHDYVFGKIMKTVIDPIGEIGKHAEAIISNKKSELRIYDEINAEWISDKNFQKFAAPILREYKEEVQHIYTSMSELLDS